MKAAVEKHGAKMIVIDPRRIELVDFAALWLPLKPGTNVPVFSAMAHVIVAGGAGATRSSSRSAPKASPSSSDSLEKFTPEYAEAVSGVDRDLIAQAARLYATAQRGAIYWGMGISAALARHRQRPGADPPGVAHRAHRARGHRAQPAARAEQRAGRLRYGRHALPLSRLHAGGRPGERRSSWEQAWNIEPGGLNRKLGLTTTEILRPRPPGRRARALHHGRKPDDDRAQPEPDPPAHAAAGIPGGAGPVHQRVRRLCRCLPAGGFLGGERRHLHQHRPARAARAPGAAAARPGAPRLADHLRPGAAHRSAAWGGPASAGWEYAHPAEIMEEMAQRRARVRRRQRTSASRRPACRRRCGTIQHPGTPYLFAESFPRGRGKFTPLEYRPRGRDAGRRIPVHPDHRARAGALARRLDDAPLQAG